MEFVFNTKDLLTHEQGTSLVSKLICSFEDMNNCFYDETNYNIIANINDSKDIVEFNLIIERLIVVEKKKRVIKTRVIKENFINLNSDHTVHLDNAEIAILFDKMVKRDQILTLYNKIDEAILEIIKLFPVSFRQYTSLIQTEVLNKCSYINNFPQNIYLVSEIPHKIDIINQIKETENITEYVRSSPYALSPAVCFHCYDEFKGTKLKKPIMISAKGNCFRHEVHWRVGGHRLFEFSMREIVFIGDLEFVENTRNQIMDTVWSLFIELGLNGKIETASDPFYYSEDFAKGQHQLMANMKYELLVSTGKLEYSIASFNNMKGSLCKPFEITNENGELLNSGCVAFGIDRWVYTLLSEFGLDIELWPDRVKNRLSLVNGVF